MALKRLDGRRVGMPDFTNVRVDEVGIRSTRASLRVEERHDCDGGGCNAQEKSLDEPTRGDTGDNWMWSLNCELQEALPVRSVSLGSAG